MIRVEALGGLRIYVNGEESVPLAKQRLKSALLVYLAVERSCMREALIGTFWPEREPERARHVLSQTVYELRKMLGEEWLTIAGDRLTVSERVTADVVEFTEAAERGAHETALRLYHGAFLDGTYLAETHEFEEWSDRRNQRVTKLLRRALRETCELPNVPAWIDIAIDVARKSAERDPTDDEIQHALIQLLVRAGRRTDALRQFEKYEAALAEDELEPLDNTRALIATIRDATDSVDPVAVTPFAQPSTTFPVPAPPRPAPAVRSNGRSAAERAAARRRSSAIAGGAVVIALAVVLPIVLARVGNTDSTKAASVTPRIAVRPLDDNSADKNLGYLTNAITEGLIDALSHVRGLEVRSKGAVRFYDGETIAEDSLARRLNVDWIVEGSLERSGDQLVASVRLVNAATGKVQESTDTKHVWSDFLEMRDTLVSDVSILLRRGIGRGVEVQLRHAEAHNEKAWEDYLRAKQIHDDFVAYMLSSGVDAAERSLGLADSLAQAAMRDDPRWAAPVLLRSRLAAQRVQVILSRSGVSNPALIRTTLEQGIDHAEKAISFDRTAAEGYELRGVMRYRLRVTPGLVTDTAVMRKMEKLIEDDLSHAVTIDSARAESWSTLSELYVRQSRFPEAQRTAQRAYEADSYYAGALETLSRLAVSSFEIGKDREARNWCEEGRRRFPQYHQFVYCTLMLMAWSDTIRPDVDSAWGLTRVSNLVASPSAAYNDAMFRLMTASVIARSGSEKRDSVLHVINAIPRAVRASPGLLWIEAAARARVGDFAHADSLVSAFVASQGIRNSWVLNSRALKPLRDEHLRAGVPVERR